MTVAISLPVGSELMVAKPDWERLFGQKMPDHLFEAGILFLEVLVSHLVLLDDVDIG